MQATSTAAGAELIGARALRQWITGERGDHARVFLVESGAAGEAVAEIAGAHDAILLPADSRPARGSATAVRYSGAFREIGDELFLGERAVELQDYIAAEFVQIVGPMAVSFDDRASWRAFLDDAELARRTGVFPTALVDPRVLLANRGALTAPSEAELPTALRVGQDGRVSIGLRGDVIGRVDELSTALGLPVDRAAALGDIAPPPIIARDLTGRPWLGRYLRATDLLKMLRAGNGAVRISGFGWSPVDDDRADAEAQESDPFLLETSEGCVLADTTTRRRQLLPPMTAAVVEITQTSASHGLAVERIARRLGVAESAAKALRREAETALGVHLGRPAVRNAAADGDLR